jgi:glucosamine--fructose-6-phosphate aminotransferase (isomerizing)
MAPVLAALRQRGADLVLVGGTVDGMASEAGNATVVPVRTDGIPEQLHPVLEILPLQQLALRLALERGVNPDAPRGLQKVTETW